MKHKLWLFPFSDRLGTADESEHEARMTNAMKHFEPFADG